MKNQPYSNYFFLVLSILSLSLMGCISDAADQTSLPQEASNPDPNMSESTAIPSTELPKETITPSKPTLQNQETEGLKWRYYRNDSWSITVVNPDSNSMQNLTYYACDQGRQNCLSLTNGKEQCMTDICTLSWINGTYKYILTGSAESKTLRVYEGAKIILESEALTESSPEDYAVQGNVIPNGSEAIAGISETDLSILLVQIQKIVLAEDWQALAAISAENITIKFPDKETTTKIPKSELAATLAQQNLEDWKIRVMTQTLDDLFLNQYGAMIGQGSIWIAEATGQPAKIITINIW